LVFSEERKWCNAAEYQADGAGNNEFNLVSGFEDDAHLIYAERAAGF
jgi:hypothetical protein